MRKAECKGRTLCLKVKLHSFEVLTRQVVPPKAVHLADDLYNYALPMLAKLEQEIPGMKLRLMGLRCTQLVSTKKPDTRAFFGLRPQRTKSAGSSGDGSGAGIIPAGGEGEWEEWPQEEATDPTSSGSPVATSPRRKHGKEIVPNPTKELPSTVEEGEFWDCPVCARPQPADERQFNEHIDLCLSRQTIRDTVQQDSAAQQQQQRQPERGTPEAQKTREKKRGRPSAPPDPRQKRLCFG
jgi:DNA polymerase kappa